MVENHCYKAEDKIVWLICYTFGPRTCFSVCDQYSVVCVDGYLVIIVDLDQCLRVRNVLPAQSENKKSSGGNTFFNLV